MLKKGAEKDPRFCLKQEYSVLELRFIVEAGRKGAVRRGSGGVGCLRLRNFPGNRFRISAGGLLTSFLPVKRTWFTEYSLLPVPTTYLGNNRCLS
jgi:hypothetical protein